jgi:hypothetical protein
LTGITTGKALGYATLPGIFPRVRSLFFSGFGNLAYFIALTYAMVRLLPGHHPYLNPENIGKYGIRHVVAAAMHDLKFDLKHTDQVVVFFALLAGIAALMMFVVALVAFALVSPVFASAYFVTSAPENDVAFMMLDRVFGIPGLFMSEVETNTTRYGAFPNAFHVGMRSLFQFYSMGLFLLSVFVLLYYVVVVITETATTGTPFGQRFDNFWIPVRLVVALALLMPGFGGLNSAQYIVLYAAKYGSGLATNTWITYNLRTGDTPVGGPIGTTNRDMIPRPAMPDYTKLIKDLIVVRGCIEMFGFGGTFTLPEEAPESFWGVSEYMVKGSTYQSLLPVPGGGFTNVPPRSPVNAVSVGGADWVPTYNGYATFQQALDFYEGGDIRLVFGTRSEDVYPNEEGYVFPHCGEVIIPVTGHTREALYIAEGYMAAVVRILYSIRRTTAPGALDQNELAMVLATSREYNRNSNSFQNHTQTLYPLSPTNRCFWDSDRDYIEEFYRGGTALPQLGNCEEAVPPSYWLSVIPRFQQAFEWGALAGYDYLTAGVTGEDMEYSIGNVSFQSLGDPNPLLMDVEVLRYGWGGAGLWYNKISEKNGSLVSAVGAAPYVKTYPAVMENIKNQRLKADSKVESSSCELYNPRRSSLISVNVSDERGPFFAESAKALYELCIGIHDNQALRPQTARSTKNSNMVMNIINALFGADTFFNLLENRNVHPMSMLSTLGRTLIDKAIFNLAAATGTSVIGGLNQLGPGKGDAGFAYITIASGNFSKAFVSFGTIALVSGVMLYYVMPFMPFMYFFFAVGRWVKTIFEAMVGVPLWALAHLSMKGPGLPSPAANAGYFLILEIFIRPVLTVFALIAAFASFAAMVMILNAIFEIVISNIFGADVKLITAATDPSLVNMRNLVDQFFLTVVYVIIVYIIGTSCFKLIDIIPDNIMRWSGAGVKTWGGSDNADELVDKTGQYVSMGTWTLARGVGDGITGLSASASDDARGVIQAAGRAKKPGAAEEFIQGERAKINSDARGQGGAGSSGSPGSATSADAGLEETQRAMAREQARTAQGPSESPAAALLPGAGAGQRPAGAQTPPQATPQTPQTSSGQTQTARPGQPQAPLTPQAPGTGRPQGTGQPPGPPKPRTPKE